jgi:hypothetical protein
MPIDRGERRYAGRPDCGCRLGCIEFYSYTLKMQKFGCFDFKKRKNKRVKRREGNADIGNRK